LRPARTRFKDPQRRNLFARHEQLETGKACTPRAAIRARHPAGAATRTLSAVFMASGVAGACSHRFLHTLATEVLELGGTFRKAADILGDTEAIVRKYYAK